MVIRKTFDSQSGTGTTDAIETLIGPTSHLTAARNHSVQATTTGGPSAATLQLEGSLDGVTWTALSPAMDVSSTTMFHVLDAPVSCVRANLVSLTGGTAPTVTVEYLGCR